MLPVVPVVIKSIPAVAILSSASLFFGLFLTLLRPSMSILSNSSSISSFSPVHTPASPVPLASAIDAEDEEGDDEDDEGEVGEGRGSEEEEEEGETRREEGMERWWGGDELRDWYEGGDEETCAVDEASLMVFSRVSLDEGSGDQGMSRR